MFVSPDMTICLSNRFYSTIQLTWVRQGPWIFWPRFNLFQANMWILSNPFLNVNCDEPYPILKQLEQCWILIRNKD